MTAAEQPQAVNVPLGREVSGIDIRLIGGRAARVTGVVEDARGETTWTKPSSPSVPADHEQKEGEPVVIVTSKATVCAALETLNCSGLMANTHAPGLSG